MSCLEQNEFAMIVVKGKFLPQRTKRNSKQDPTRKIKRKTLINYSFMILYSSTPQSNKIGIKKN